MMRSWLMQHWFVFFLTLKRLIATPLTSLLSIIVMGIVNVTPDSFSDGGQYFSTLSRQPIFAGSNH